MPLYVEIFRLGKMPKPRWEELERHILGPSANNPNPYSVYRTHLNWIRTQTRREQKGDPQVGGFVAFAPGCPPSSVILFSDTSAVSRWMAAATRIVGKHVWVSVCGASGFDHPEVMRVLYEHISERLRDPISKQIVMPWLLLFPEYPTTTPLHVQEIMRIGATPTGIQPTVGLFVIPHRFEVYHLM